MKESAIGGRVSSLDSLRGIAATVVLMSHVVNSIRGVDDLLWADPNADRHFHWDWLSAITFTPLHVFWSGHEAVLIFFVLSGLVLTLSILKIEEIYPAFVAKRVCRIWLPFCASIGLGLALWGAFRNLPISPDYSNWLIYLGELETSPKNILAHLLMLGRTGETNINYVMWSLIHEMRISLVMPLIVALVLRSTLGSVTLMLACLSLGFLVPGIHKLQGIALWHSLAQTALYLPLFIIGTMIAVHSAAIRSFFLSSRASYTVILWIIAILLLEWRWLVSDDPRITFIAPSIGAALVVVLSFASPAAVRVLHHRVLIWLGRISYSLYLVHLLVLVAVVRLLGNLLPVPIVLSASIIASFSVASLFHKLVERPAQRLGSLLASRLGSAHRLSEAAAGSPPAKI